MAVNTRDAGNLDVLKVKFTHSNTVRDKKPYTIYEIEVRSSSTITWVIYKRYSDFFALHQSLQKLKAAATHGELLTVQLPILPPKRLTRSLAVEFVERRKSELEDYLAEILKKPALCHNDVILSFLEVPDSVRPMLARSGAADGSTSLDSKDASGDGVSASLMNSRSYQQKSFEERRVLELVNLLTYNKNKVAAIKQFEDYFFENRPRLTPDAIRVLFQGERGVDNEGGLVQTCGDAKYSTVASRAALDLLVRLLDVEKNKDAQLFLDTFCTLDPGVLQKLQLHVHILNERNRMGAFRLASLMRSKLPDGAFERIITDPYARQEFFRFVERKNEAITPAINEPQETQVRSINLAEVGHKKITEQAVQDMLSVAHNELGWRVVKYQRHEPPVPLSQSQSSDSSAVSRPAAPALSVSISGSPVAAQGKERDKENQEPGSQARITYRIDQRRDLVIVRLTTMLPFSVDAVTKLLLDANARKEWDFMFHRGRRIEKIDADTDVVHYVFKSFSSPYKYRDFCLLRGLTKLDNGTSVISTRSIVHPRVPEQKDNVRAVLFPTGYIVSPVSESSEKKDPTGCLLTFIAQLDREGVLIVSPDLLGETNQLCRSIEFFKTCLQKRLSTPASQPSPLVGSQATPQAFVQRSQPTISAPIPARPSPAVPVPIAAPAASSAYVRPTTTPSALSPTSNTTVPKLSALIPPGGSTVGNPPALPPFPVTQSASPATTGPGKLAIPGIFGRK